MKANFSRIVALVLTLAMLALCMAGCGGSQNTPAATDGTDAPSPLRQQIPTAQLRKKKSPSLSGILTVTVRKPSS